jgi:DNA-binding NarL/FixJ family response regulator
VYTTEKALELRAGLKIIALAMFTEDAYYMQMIGAGAQGFALKKSGKSELQLAIN